MEYHSVFDVIQNGLHWQAPFVILLAACLALLIGWALRRGGEREAFIAALIFQVVGGIGLLGALTFFVTAVAEYHAASAVLADRRYSVVEGVVSDFVPMPPGGHALESFRVNGVAFSYGSGWGSTYFNSEWNVGAVHDGVRARIAYCGTDILRIEVK
jgi:hypothetical protein